jgi:hypothetical protein
MRSGSLLRTITHCLSDPARVYTRSVSNVRYGVLWRAQASPSGMLVHTTPGTYRWLVRVRAQAPCSGACTHARVHRLLDLFRFVDRRRRHRAAYLVACVRTSARHRCLSGAERTRARGEVACMHTTAPITVHEKHSECTSALYHSRSTSLP